MGLTKFKRAFRQATGYPWAAYLTAQRMREAKALLASGKSVAETAAEVGYRSPTSFSAAFAKEVGVSPQRFKGRSGVAVASVGGEAVDGSRHG